MRVLLSRRTQQQQQRQLQQNPSHLNTSSSSFTQPVTISSESEENLLVSDTIRIATTVTATTTTSLPAPLIATPDATGTTLLNLFPVHVPQPPNPTIDWNSLFHQEGAEQNPFRINESSELQLHLQEESHHNQEETSSELLLGVETSVKTVVDSLKEDGKNKSYCDIKESKQEQLKSLNPNHHPQLHHHPQQELHHSIDNGCDRKKRKSSLFELDSIQDQTSLPSLVTTSKKTIETRSNTNCPSPVSDESTDLLVDTMRQFYPPHDRCSNPLEPEMEDEEGQGEKEVETQENESHNRKKSTQTILYTSSNLPVPFDSVSNALDLQEDPVHEEIVDHEQQSLVRFNNLTSNTRFPNRNFLDSKISSRKAWAKALHSNSASVHPKKFQLALKKRGLEMIEQKGDGNCLFRAVSLQVYGDSDQHYDVRRRCIDYMEKEKDHFSQFVNDEPFDEYIHRKRQDGEHGNNLEIQAISELFNRPVEVFVPEQGATLMNIFHKEYKTSDTPIRLSYHDGNHYNAVIDPLCPTAGLGLGLPGLEPGLADRLQLELAKDESDKIHVRKVAEDSYQMDIQQAIQESKKSSYSPSFSADNGNRNRFDLYAQQKFIALSDWETTDLEMEQVALENSFVSYWNVEEENRKQPWNNAFQQRRRVIPNLRQKLTGSPPLLNSNGNESFPDHSNTSASTTGGLITSIESFAACNTSSPTSNVAYTMKEIDSLEECRRSPVGKSTSSSNQFASASSTEPDRHDETSRSEWMDKSGDLPKIVQELVMNGFDLSKVIHAYDLIGDNFDDLLTFLLQTAS